MQQITVERDASGITGRPHTYFGDLLSAIAAQTNGPLALVNADIFIPAGAQLAERVRSLGPGHMIFSRRLDVAELGASGRPFFNGYDFFAAHSDDVAGLAENRLVFGAPWWDHFFPLAMHLRGCQVTQLEPQVVHLRHDERWSWGTWTKLGDQFIAEMRPMAAGEYARHLRRILASETHGRRAAARILTRLRRRRPLEPTERHQLVLGRVSNLNLSVIDLLAPPPPLKEPPVAGG